MRKSVALLLSLSALSAVSACGGSSVSGEQSVSIDATTIRLFADDSGVARLVAVSNGEVTTGYVITPELTSVLAEIESTSEVTPFEIESLSIVDTGPNINIRSGAISVEGGVLNVLAATTTDDDAALVLFEEPSSGLTFLGTEGYQATNIPSSGTFIYSGVLGLQDMVFDETPEIGTFAAVAGFDGVPSITLSGGTASYDVNGTALISGGSFASASVTIDGVGFSVPASMNGDFHGEGANSVAGVIYSNDDAGDFRGGFVGSQD